MAAAAMRNSYGPPGEIERIYADPYGPYGPNSQASPRRSFLRSAHRTVAGGRLRTACPPHDMTAALPHPSGHHLSRTGTWRSGDVTRQVEGVVTAQRSVQQLVGETMPDEAYVPRTVLSVQRSHLSLADGRPDLHTDTIAPPAVLRAPNVWPHYFKEHFERDGRSTKKVDGSGVSPFLCDVPGPPFEGDHPDHGQAAPISLRSTAWLPGERRFHETMRALPAERHRSRAVALEDRTLLGGWRFGYNPGHSESLRSRYR